MGTGDRRGRSPTLEGTDWPASKGHGLVTRLQGNGAQQRDREDTGVGK